MDDPADTDVHDPDDELRDDLLEEADAYLNRLASDALAELSQVVLPDEVDPPLPEDTRLGAYRVVHELSRGGMGTVYVAERDDGQFEHQVAVKVLRRGLDTDDIVERFRRERQILASMKHAGIAALIDGGALPDGRPYLVMELVDGQPIDVHCEARSCTVEERLDLFLQVTDAVEYAHRHLVVHRDLKPSNILVTADGHVRLLDFGIAKLLGPDTVPLDHTRDAAALLTPAYASPEQLRGGPITTASDVYQLGLLLYRLLCGRPPPRGEPTPFGPGEIGDPPPPSTLCDPGDVQLRRRLRGDLDAVVLMAMRPDPESRYATVAELSGEIRRLLRGLPVAARRGSRAYLARRFVARHRAAVAAASVFALTLGLYGAGIARERDRARVQALRADRVMELLVGMFESIDPDMAQGEAVTVREVLAEGIGRIGEDLQDQPDVEAELLSVVGGVYHRLGLFPDAEPLLRRVVALREPDDPRRADDLQRLGLVTQSSDLPFAVSTLREALGTAERTRPPDDLSIARILVDLAYVLPWNERQPLLDRAFTILRASEEDVRIDLAHALTIQAYTGPPELAEPRHREALELRRAARGDDHSSVASSMADIALILEFSDPSASDSLNRHAIDIFTRMLGPDHALTLTTLNNFAAVLRDRGEYAAAEPLFREVLERRTRAYPGAEVLQVYPMYGLGFVLAEQGKVEEAEPLLRHVVEVLTRHYGEDDGRVQAARATLGRSLALQGHFAEAEPLLLAALAWEEQHADEWIRRRTARRIVDLYEAWNRPADAERYRGLAGEG